jgi:hemolysin activation/secretion protein
VAVGQVSNKFMAFNLKDTKYGFGTGLRFQLSKSQKLNLRLDYAWASDKSTGFYLSIGEAF